MRLMFRSPRQAGLLPLVDSSRPATVLAIRFHCSGELSTQNSATCVCSGERALGVVTPSPPRRWISFTSAAYRRLVTGYGGPGRYCAAVPEYEGRHLAEVRSEGERRADGGREAVLARSCALGNNGRR